MTKEENDFTASNQGEEKRRPGRPKNSTTGARPFGYVVIGLVNGQIISEDVFPSVNASEEEKLGFSSKIAMSLFEKKYGAKPSKCHGPFSNYKGTNRVVPKEDEDISLDLKEVKFTGISEPGIYRSWKGMAHNIKDHDDYVVFIADTPIEAKDQKKKAPPAKIVARSSLTLESFITIGNN